MRTDAGDGPFFSPVLGAWLVATADGSRLRIAADREATVWWSTAEEAGRAAKEALAVTDAALACVAELEATLRSRG